MTSPQQSQMKIPSLFEPQQNDTTDWFGGRRAETLSDVATGTTKISVEEAETKFLMDLDRARNIRDPMELMWQYVTWFEENFPSGKQKYFYPILYKICTKFCSMERYKNDDRILKLWFKLAENFPESALAVMEFAFSRGSCRQLAKFYVRWSEMYQTLGWWNKAREKLQFGVNMCAMPLQWLHTAMDELEARVMRTTKRSDEEETDDSPLKMKSSRETLGKLRGIGRKHFAPIIRTPHGPPGILTASKGMKRPAQQDTFMIFSDESSQSSDQPQEERSEGIKAKRSKIAVEFDWDQEYQALFGYFDQKEKIDLQFTNEENNLNLLNPTCKIRSSSRNCNNGDEYKIYADESDETNDIAGKESGRARVRKPRLKLKKELVKKVSIEEAYAKRILKKTQKV